MHHDKPGVPARPADTCPVSTEAARHAALALAAEGIDPAWLRSQAAGEHRAMLQTVADELDNLGRNGKLGTSLRQREAVSAASGRGEQPGAGTDGSA